MTTITDEQVEAAARELFKDCELKARSVAWSHQWIGTKDFWRGQARAALTAAAQAGKPWTMDALLEAIRRTRTRLEFYCNEANAGRMPSDAREFARRVQCGFDSLFDDAEQIAAHEGERVEPPLPATQITEDDGTGDIISPAWRPPTSAPATPGRADDWQGKVDTAMDLYELATSPSPPAQSVEGDLQSSLRRACRYETITPQVRSYSSFASNGLVLDAADRIATLTKELAEARKVIELNVRETSSGICGMRSRLSILIEINKVNRDWLERNKP